MEDTDFRGCGTRPTTRNRVELLNDAAQMYASLIAALHRARSSILLEYYIFDDDRVGRTISDVLIRRARNGVKVCVIYDLLGSWMPAWGMLRKLRRAGVEVRYFRPFELCHPWRSLNVRNHRKVAIIDNRVAYLGGINIARRYLEGNELGRWRDEHLRIEGPAVGELQRLFLRDWVCVGGSHFPIVAAPPASNEPSIKRGSSLRILYSQEGPTRRSIEEEFIQTIRCAKVELLLATPYYIPPPSLRRALLEALARGVRIELMVPARADLCIAARAAACYYGELLEHGATIWLYENGFLHTKMLLADRRFALLGTANLDYRSLRTNWEVVVCIDDPCLGEKLHKTFRRDKEHCTFLRYAFWKRRPLWIRLQSRLAQLFRRWL